ncbi:MAG TPA: hypothetical protein VFI03_02420 [Solirubrobacterales bacterium]|nr:hypothetical protein [Solirubrobacterales bacterium]
MRSHTRASVVVIALFAFFAFAAPAFGAYVEVGSFATNPSNPGGFENPIGSGSADGQLSNPGQADINGATGNLYVADTNNNRVQVFKPNATGGEYDSQLAITAPTGLAIDQDTGDVYVANASGVSKFTSALAPIGVPDWTAPAATGPLAVDPSTGDLLLADTAANLIRRFESDGTAAGTFAAEGPIDLAADSTGDVLVVTSTGNVALECGATSAVKRYSGAGVEEGTVGASLTAPGAVAVDSDDDSIVIGARVNQYNCGSQYPQVAFFDSAGVEAESHDLTADTQYAMFADLAAAGGASSRVYAISKSPANDNFGNTKITTFEIPEPTAPEVVGQSVLRGAEDATLRATVDPGGLASDYHFEYGTTTAYGEQTDEESLAASFEPTQVSAQISGLAPGTTYHYRVVAENSLDETPGPDRTFRTVAADSCPNEAFRTGFSYLTDCRAFELVTPFGANADIRVAGGPVTPDGDVVCFNTEDSLLGSAPNGMKNADDGFCSWLTASGWESKWVTGPASPTPSAFALGSNVYFLSPDGKRLIFASDGNLLGDDYVPGPGVGVAGTVSSYMWEAGETSWLAPPGPGPYLGQDDGALSQRRPLAVSEDLTRGIFWSEERILPEDENSGPDIYEWSPGGLRVVSTDSSGKAAGGAPGYQEAVVQNLDLGVIDFGALEQMEAPPGAMSADGSRVFFGHSGAPLDGDTTEAPEGDGSIELAPIQSVYMREGNEITLISPRRGSGPDSAVYFVGATADGDVAYLETTQQLTPEVKQSYRAIYRYDVATDELELVADAPGGVRFLTLSPDGSTVLYRERATNDLIVEHNGVTTTLGKFTVADTEGAQTAGNTRQDQRMLRVSPDGSVVIFAAAGEFAGFGPGPRQVYRWEAGEGIERISAVEGAEPAANASIGAYAAALGDRAEFFYNHNAKGNRGRVMSDDGSRVFFETTEALVNRDVNNLTDVYEWHDGEINIVSTGTGGKALYHGSSADGKTVFLTTFDRLLPQWDRNGKRDLYAVRPDGGFAPPAPPPSCEGRACQSAQAAPPASDPGEGSGAANLQRGLADAKLVKGGKSVRVSVLAPGKVTATLAAKLGKGKAVTVAKASKSASKAGALILPVKLSAKAKKVLAERGRLPVTLTVTHVQSDQTITRKVTLHG